VSVACQAREEIINDFDRALTPAEREACLGLYQCLMDAVEKTMAPVALDKFRETRAHDYRVFLIKEAAIGSDDEYLKLDRLAAITRREVEAGRLRADDGLHQLAVSADTVLTPRPPSGIVAKLRGWLGL
jgi:hypothetical protein